MTLIDFVQTIAVIKSHAEFSVTSWWRSEKKNIEVGGDPDSLHLVGLAVDVEPDTKKEWYRIIHWAKRLGLKYKEYPKHIHLQIP